MDKSDVVFLQESIQQRKPVAEFANAMECKLSANDHKGGWEDCSPVYLGLKAHIELSELYSYLMAYEEEREDLGHPEGYTIKQLTQRCVDVANYVMMLADVIGGLKK